MAKLIKLENIVLNKLISFKKNSMILEKYLKKIINIDNIKMFGFQKSAYNKNQK